MGDTKFQLIWPTNEARASRNHFFGNFRAFFEKLSFFQKSHFFFIFLLCQPLGLWVPTRPPRHCGRVGTHHGGVRSNFRCLQSHLKKKRKNKIFFFWQKKEKKKKKKKKKS